MRRLAPRWAAVGAGTGAEAGDGSGGPCSFSADTLVATPGGERAIGSLKVGDLVAAYDTVIGQTAAEPVQHVWIHHDHDLVDVRVQSAGASHATTPHAPSGTARSQDSAGGHSQRPAGKAGGRRLRATLVAGLLGLSLLGAAASPAQAAVPTSTGTPTSQETVHTTATHPWLTADHGWVRAGLLHI